MKINLSDEYKSLQPFISEELNDFTLITGKNGSGKSQLLDLLSKKSRNDASVISVRIEIEPTLTKIQSEGIIKENAKKIGHDQWKAIINKHLTKYKQLSNTSKEFIQFILNKNLKNTINQKNRRTFLSEEPQYKELIVKLYSENNQTVLAPIADVKIHMEKDALRRVFVPENENTIRFIEELCKSTGKKETDLTDSDFFNTPIEEHYVDENDLFTSQIELVFYNYAKRRDLNRKNYFYKKEEGEKNNSISDKEFTKHFKPPWKIINEILEFHNLDFYFKGIEKSEFTIEVPIDFKLYKKSSNQEIPFNDLSSGEKVIIGLILKLFVSEYYGSEMTFPELLVLDEPDSHLHPEMSKLLLDVLQDTFVKKYNIKVLVTTHSPSTIALAPENCIYQLSNGKNTSLKKISKDDALKILTSFIPTLSIDYKNHKQVFVESPTDVLYFQNLHDKHQQNKSLDYKLYFISNSPGKSNCSQVYKIVEEIRKSGNTTAYGIVDWDLTNKPKSNVYVHGLNERYSVENFILDPIYILCLLIDMGNAHGICQKTGLDITYNQFMIGTENEDKLQQLTSYFFNEFEKKFPAYKYDSKKVHLEYLNKKHLEVPEWYVKMQGHKIVDMIKKIFPALDKFKNEGELQNKLSVILTKCYPFVPITTINLLEKI